MNIIHIYHKDWDEECKCENNKIIRKNNINLNNFYNKIFKLPEINKAIKYMSQKKSYERILIKF